MTAGRLNGLLLGSGAVTGGLICDVCVCTAAVGRCTWRFEKCFEAKVFLNDNCFIKASI